MRQWLAFCAVAILAPLPVARAGDNAPPTFVLQFRSLDTLVENVKTLVALAGREEIANQVEGLFRAKIGVKGLEGIDTKRPLGAYGRFGKEIDDISGAVLVPIVDEKAFIGLLENLNLQVTKGKDGVYTVQTGTPIEAYIRFARGYAYVTALNPAAIDPGKLLDPMQVLGKTGPTFSAALRIDQLPEPARQIAVAQVEQGLQEALEAKKAGETEAERALRIAATRELTKTVVGIIQEGSEIKLSLDLNPNDKELSAKLSLAGKPGTELDKAIRDLGKRQSLFGRQKDAQAAFFGGIHLVLPEGIKRSLDKLVDQGTRQAVEQIRDPEKRKQAERLLEALGPTFRSGELDAFAQLIGPNADRKYTVLAGVKVAQGDKLGATVRDLLKDLLNEIPEPFRSRIQLDAASVGDVKIHRFDLPEEEKGGAQLQELVGDTNLYVAFREDAVLLAAGKNGLDTLKKAIGVKEPGPSSVFMLEVDVARMAALAPTDELRQSAKQIFGDGKSGLIRVVVDGGDRLHLTMTTRLAVIQFLSQTREFKGQ